MFNHFEHIQLFRDQPFKRQFQELLSSPVVQSLKLDQYLLFKLEQDWTQSSYLVLCAATGILPSEIVVQIDNNLLPGQTSETWCIQDVQDPVSKAGPFGILITRLGGRSALIAPMKQKGLLWGFLVGYSIEKINIGANDLQLFSLLTFSMLALVENSQLRLGVNFRASEAQSLEKISSALVENKSLTKTLSLIADKTVRLLHAQDALVLLLEEGGEWFRVEGKIGESVTRLVQRRLTVRNSLNGLVITTGQPLISQDAQVDPRANQDRAMGLNVKSVIIAPLKIREQVIGTMAVHNKDGGYFSEQDVNTLCSFANQAAVAIDNTQLLKALMKSQKEVEEKAKMLEQLLQQTMSIQENERRRIAADIHDGVVSQIVGALYELEGCCQIDSTDELDERLQLLKQLLNQAVDTTRTSIYNLWPATLDHMGLLSALQELFKHQEKTTSLRHRLDVHGSPYQLSPSTQIAAYRIVQEAINNSFQHGSAKHIDMLIKFGDQRVSIEICDDGRGFDVQQVLTSPLACHFGLIGMQERARSIGGGLNIHSEPGKGCKIILDIPNAGTPIEGIPVHESNTDINCR